MREDLLNGQSNQRFAPKIAYVLDGRVVIEPINKELLSHIPFLGN